MATSRVEVHLWIQKWEWLFGDIWHTVIYFYWNIHHYKQMMCVYDSGSFIKIKLLDANMLSTSFYYIFWYDIYIIFLWHVHNSILPEIVIFLREEFVSVVLETLTLFNLIPGILHFMASNKRQSVIASSGESVRYSTISQLEWAVLCHECNETSSLITNKA